MTAKLPTASKQWAPIPADLADAALLDVKDVCAATRMSPSWVYDAVHAGRFPAPVVRGRKFTRWSQQSVREWLLQLRQPAAG